MGTKTTKRTTANTATDVEGQAIQLRTTRLTSHRGHNTLLYTEVRRAVTENDTTVLVRTGNKRAGYSMDLRREFGRLPAEQIPYLSTAEQNAAKLGPIFNIGCHAFTLRMFNRILRAAGIRTTKPQTLKRFAAAA